jgi:hypothetical protein
MKRLECHHRGAWVELKGGSGGVVAPLRALITGGGNEPLPCARAEGISAGRARREPGHSLMDDVPDARSDRAGERRVPVRHRAYIEQ